MANEREPSPVDGGGVDVVLATIDRLRAIDQEHIAWYVRFAAVLAGAGIGAVLLVYFGVLDEVRQPEVMKGVAGGAGILSAALSSLPLQHLMAKRDRMRTFDVIRYAVLANPDRARYYYGELEKLLFKRVEA